MRNRIEMKLIKIHSLKHRASRNYKGITPCAQTRTVQIQIFSALPLLVLTMLDWLVFPTFEALTHCSYGKLWKWLFNSNNVIYFLILSFLYRNYHLKTKFIMAKDSEKLPNFRSWESHQNSKVDNHNVYAENLIQTHSICWNLL